MLLNRIPFAKSGVDDDCDFEMMMLEMMLAMLEMMLEMMVEMMLILLQ